MHRGQRASQRGLTLIEILLSIIILVVGVLGILAFFPTALRISAATIDQRAGINLAESVKHSMDTAMRFAVNDGGADDGKVIMTHDMDAGDAFPYLFFLPALDGVTSGNDGWRRHPSASSDAYGDSIASNPIPSPETYPQFSVASDAWLNATVDYVHTKNDPTDPYRQYAFSFDIAKVNTLEHLLSQINPDTGVNYTADELDLLIRLYEVRIHVFRKKGGTSTGTGSGNSVAKNLILTVTHRVAQK